MVKTSRKAIGKSLANECCHRCGGLMVSENVFELGAFNWRCVSCGERIDPIILQHRREERARAEAAKLFAGQGKSSLN